MNDAEIMKLFTSQEERIRALEEKLHKPKQVIPAGTLQGLPEHIRNLRDNEFFSEPHTPTEVHTELLKKYHCDKARVEVALSRLAKKRELRKTSKQIGEKKLLAYAW